MVLHGVVSVVSHCECFVDSWSPGNDKDGLWGFVQLPK